MRAVISIVCIGFYEIAYKYVYLVDIHLDEHTLNVIYFLVLIALIEDINKAFGSNKIIINN